MPWPPEADDWHYAYGVSDSTTDDNLAGHGSCVASKAAGWKTGVSKNSQLVVMKSLPTLADVNFAFAAALDDIIEKNRQGKTVVVYPATSIQTFGAGSSLPRNWQSVRELIQELLAQDVVVVTAAGNHAARSSAPDTVPAIWALDPNFPLIVAGAVTTDGTIARFSQGAAASSEIVWAPGKNIVCANGPSSPGLAVRSGTSFAAAMVSTTSIRLHSSSMHLNNEPLGCRTRCVRIDRGRSPPRGIGTQRHPLQASCKQSADLSVDGSESHLEQTIYSA